MVVFQFKIAGQEADETLTADSTYEFR